MIYTMKNDKLTVQVNSFGAELTSVCDAAGKEYLWQGDAATWEEQAPHLFPYIARLTNGTYEYAGQRYEMKIHGFAKYMELEAEQISDTEVVFKLQANAETKAQYPFDFCLSIGYVLEGAKLNISYRVENQDEKKMYFGIGGHPGFQVPLEEGLSFEDYELVFGEKKTPERILFTEDCYVTGEKTAFALEEEQKLPLSHKMFDDDAIVLTNMSKSVTLQSKKGKKKITVSYPQMDYLGIWHWPKTEVGYVCIEPWSSLPSRKDVIEKLEEQENLIALEAGKTYQNSWSIEVQGE